MKRSHFKGVRMTRTERLIENVLDAKIQITLSENVQSHQEIKTKGLLVENLGAIAVKNRERRPKTKHALWLKHLMRIPYNGQAVFTNEWGLASLAYSQETEGPYHTDLPTPDDIRQFLQLNRVELNRTMKSQNVVLTPNQILPKELSQEMKALGKLIRKNGV
ncbi:hypothetical protein Tco_0488120 [Tanacetum coccineum]